MHPSRFYYSTIKRTHQNSENYSSFYHNSSISQLTALGRNDSHPWTIIKVNNNLIYAYHLPSDTLHKLIPNGRGDERERWENGNLKYYFGQRWENGFSKISQLADEGNELFLIPNYFPLNPSNANGIGADFISHAPALFAEIDDLTIPQQWEKIKQLEDKLGLAPSLVVSSGGKSLHIYFRLTTPLTDLEHWKQLQRKLICTLGSDPAIANPNREMRLAGVERKSKGSFQSLELERDRAYSPNEIEGILDSTGKFPYGLDDDRFRRWRREGDEVLAFTPEQLNPSRPPRPPRERNKINGVIGSGSIEDALKSAEDSLGYEDIFHWEGHHFKQNGSKLVGYCPQHSSTSGTAFQINPKTNEWFCHGCQEGGHAVQYRHFLNGGIGTPTGKEFIEIAKELCEDANIPFPESDQAQWLEDQEPWLEPDDEIYQDHQEELEREEETANLDKERDRELWRENYPYAAKNCYKRLKQFTPDIEINKEFLSLDDIPLERNTMVGIKSSMGTNKTGVMEEVVNTINDKPLLEKEGWLVIGHRNNLLIQSGNRWGFIHLKSAEARGESVEKLIKDNQSKILCCFDSLYRFSPEDFDGRNLILDETTAGILHLLTSNTEVSKRLEQTCELFKEALQRANRVFCLDALLTDSAITYLHKLAPNKSVTKIQNNYKKPVHITNFIGTEEEVEGQLILRKNKRNPLVDILNDSNCPVIVSDSQQFCAAIESIFKKKGREGIRIDGETSGEEWAKDCMNNPDEYIRKHQPSFFIISPSLESGGDISIKNYFTEQFGFFFGAISTDAQHQMMFRVRDPDISRYLWCKEFDSNRETLRSPFPNTNMRNHQSLLMNDILNCYEEGEDIREKLDVLSQMNKENPHDEMWSKLEAIQSQEKGNLRECLVESLEASGHTLIDLSLENLSQQNLEKDAKDETKDRYSQDIFNAEEILPQEIEERKQGGKWSDQCAVSKAVLKLQLPDIEETEHWSPEVIRLLKYDERDRIRQLERWWMLCNLDDAKKIQRQRWEKVNNGLIHKFHLRSDYSKILALIEAGIEKFLERDREWQEDDPEVKEFIKNCQKYDFKLAFGKSPSKKTYPMHWIGTCLDFFGCDWKERRRRIEGERIRFYHLVPTLETDSRNPTFYDCIAKRFTKTLENIESEKMAETQTQQELDPVPELPAVFKQDSSSGTVQMDIDFKENDHPPVSYSPPNAGSLREGIVEMLEEAPQNIFHLMTTLETTEEAIMPILKEIGEFSHRSMCGDCWRLQSDLKDTG